MKITDEINWITLLALLLTVGFAQAQKVNVYDPNDEKPFNVESKEVIWIFVSERVIEHPVDNSLLFNWEYRD